MDKNIKNKNSGALLLELLIVIALIATIFTVGTQALLVSMRSGKSSTEKDIANSLANEAIEIGRGIADGDWQNVYAPTDIVKGTTHYYPLKINNTWTLSQGDESLVVNNISFTRYIIISNTSRDQSTRNIESTYVSTDDDPNTQKISAYVSWSGGDTVSVSSYLYRWRNKACTQTAWTTQTTPTDTAVTCPSSTYYSADSGIDASVTGTLQLTGTTPRATTGTVISSIFDLGETGAGLNSIMWVGSLGGAGANTGKVKFQVAASASATGPWVYYGGSTCGTSDWFDPTLPNTPSELKGANCLTAWSGARYIRYKAMICSNDCSTPSNYSPTVNGIMINWAP